MLVPCTNQSGDSAHATPAWRSLGITGRNRVPGRRLPPQPWPSGEVRLASSPQMHARSGLLARFRYADELASKLGGPPR